MTNLESILKSRDTTLLTKVHTVKAMVFSVVMYRWYSWTIKKLGCLRTDAFKSWCWRRLSRVPWTAMRSNQSILKEINPEHSLEGLMVELNQSILKEINPEYSLEGLMVELKLQYSGRLMGRTNSLEKTLILGKTCCFEQQLLSAPSPHGCCHCHGSHR